jgi:hypothetical protein
MTVCANFVLLYFCTWWRTKLTQSYCSHVQVVKTERNFQPKAEDAYYKLKFSKHQQWINDLKSYDSLVWNKATHLVTWETLGASTYNIYLDQTSAIPIIYSEYKFNSSEFRIQIWGIEMVESLNCNVRKRLYLTWRLNSAQQWIWHD